MYAIVRGDLFMPAGKAAAQCGHAFVDSLVSAPPDIVSQYRAEGHGTKIVLLAPDEPALHRAYRDACDAGIPCSLVTDSGHVLPPHFDGSPIVTALGLGPVPRELARFITSRFQLMP
jgi:PTH2 family peptidyl-tRNA hydrolase